MRIQNLRTWRTGLTIAACSVAAFGCRHQIGNPTDLSVSAGPHSRIEASPAKLTPENAVAEAATTAALIAAIKKSVAGSRDAHPKAHGCFDGVTLSVDRNLPDIFQNRLFEPGRTYQSAVRFSHGSGDPQASDLINDIHGFALKIFLDDHFEVEPPIRGVLPLVDPATRQPVGQVDVHELRLSKEHGVGERYYHSVDIITINGIEEFMVDRLTDYPDFFKTGGVLKELIPYLLGNSGAIPDHLQGSSLALAIEAGPLYQEYRNHRLEPAMLSALIVEIKNAAFKELFNKTRGGEDGAIAKLVHKANAHRTWDVLKSTYQSFVPYRYGGEASATEGLAVKYQLQAIDCSSKKPVNLDNTAPPDYVRTILDSADKENFLGSVIKQQVRAHDHCFALKAQLWQEGFPSLDSASGVWGDRQYTRIAELRIPQNSILMNPTKCERLSFNPGHGPLEFQGAGEMQRARRLIYAAIETLRNQQNLGLQR